MKKLALFLFATSMSLFFLIGCEKEQNTILKSSSLSSNTSFSTMMNQFISEGVYMNSDHILVFNNDSSFNQLYNLLVRTTDFITTNDTSITEMDVLFSFSESYGFESLYQTIEMAMIRLESGDNLFETNDPDNHFIVDDYFRALLTPYGEVKIGDVTYIFRDEYTLGVLHDNSKIIRQIRSLIDRNANEDDYYFLCNENPDLIIVSPDSICLTTDFIPQSCGFTYNFLNMTSCEDYNGVSYCWDFGDGTTSTNSDPTHTYSTSGNKTVRLIASHNGINKIVYKVITVGRGVSSLDFNYTHNNSGKYFFTVHASTPNDSPLYYRMYFGDGTDTIIYTSSSSVRIPHKYNSLYYNTSVTVVLEMGTTNGLFQTTSKYIEVKYKNCKKNCSAQSLYHFYNNYYVKTSMQAINVGILRIHRLNSKTIFKRKKNNNSYVREKANWLSTGWVGDFYTERYSSSNSDCGNSHHTNLGIGKEKVKSISYSQSVSNIPFSVDYHSIHAFFQAIKNGQNSSQLLGAAIYD